MKHLHVPRLHHDQIGIHRVFQQQFPQPQVPFRFVFESQQLSVRYASFKKKKMKTSLSRLERLEA